MSYERLADLSPRLRIPQPNCAVVRARDDTRAIRRECDRADPTLFPMSGLPICFPVSQSQIRTVSLFEPETTRVPSGENATERTWSVCPWNGPPICFPVAESLSLIVPSSDPETMRAPLGEKATDRTRSVCPFRASPTCAPVSKFHIRIVLSAEPEAMCFPSGEIPMERRSRSCPLNTCKQPVKK